MPPTSVRCPTPHGGGHPPFGVGNVVAAPRISSITLSTAPFETVSANLIASFGCIFSSWTCTLIKYYDSGAVQDTAHPPNAQEGSARTTTTAACRTHAHGA